MKPSIASLIAIAISGVCLVAADDESIINANEYLTGQAQNADNDVKKINVANAFEETQVRDSIRPFVVFSAQLD